MPTPIHAENKLVIEIITTEPAEAKQQLIKALTASMRWLSIVEKSEEHYSDKANQYRLAELLDRVNEAVV